MTDNNKTVLDEWEYKSSVHSEYIRREILKGYPISGGGPGSGAGVDISEEKIEFKETCSKTPKFLLYQKDYQDSEWIVGIWHISRQMRRHYIVRTKDLKRTSCKATTYRPTAFSKIAVLNTISKLKTREKIFEIIDEWNDSLMEEN